ncbi:MAG: OmpA family protein, partial [Thiogranum sp.]
LDSAGNVVTSGSGECVQTGAWNQDLSTPECDPALVFHVEAERWAVEEDARRAAELAAFTVASTLVRLSDKRNVMFEFNSTVPTATATQELDKVLGTINEFDQLDGIEIVGHTDSSGAESYNQSLSEHRAASVKQFLESRGVLTSEASARCVGEADPVASNATRDGRALNRRVDIIISGNAVE